MSAATAYRKRFPVLVYLDEFRHAKWRVLLALGLAIVKHSPVVLIPVYTRYIIDTVIPARDLVGVGLCLLGMAAMLLMNVAVHPLFARLYCAVRRDVALRLRARLCTRIQQLAFSYHDRESPGRLHSKVMQDVERLDNFGKLLIDPLALAVLTVVAALVIIVVTEPYFLFVVLAFLPVVYVQNRILRRRIAQEFESLRKEQEKLNAEVSEMLSMLPVTRAHATEAHDLDRINRRLESLRNRGIGADWLTNILQSQIWASSQLITIAVVGVGAILVITNRMSIGEVVMFLSLVGMTIGGLSGIMAQMIAVYESNEAVKSINEILSVPDLEENDGKPEIGPLVGEIEFQDVWFTYPGTDRPVLKNLDLKVDPQQTIALVGASGGGKTTLVKLILGLYQPIQGRILVDGRPLTEIDIRSFRRQIGIVTQDTFLFNGTVRENLSHGLEHVSEDDLRAAARDANALDFIEAMPDGFDSSIGSSGVRLSGGQKQRLSIARAILRKPRLLLLDEATSALDSESERQIQSALETLLQGRTAFVIAHRLSTISNADRILVFDEGQIVEDGRHEILVEQGGLYARLVQMQSIA
ncbi:ABC transporter ATP-binding protein/permease [bacterium]|nr:ABC transporter ATP-binding protein/permease [bacterium]